MPGQPRYVSAQTRARVDILGDLQPLFKKCCDVDGMRCAGTVDANQFEGMVQCAADITKMKDTVTKRVSTIVDDHKTSGLVVQLPKNIRWYR